MTTLLNQAHKEVNGLTLYFKDDVAIIVMDRHDNRFNAVFYNAFNMLLDEVERSESCKALITTGKGKFFSNGLDLENIESLSGDQSMAVFTNFIVFLKRLMFLSIPTMAVMNGHAFAGGALIALAHDVRTMNTDKGWFCLNEVFIKRQFGNFNLALLEAKLGKGKNLTDAAVLGKRFTAQEALNCGIVHAIQPPRLLLQESIRVLKSYYGKGYPRSSLKTMKEDVYRDALACYERDGIDNKSEMMENVEFSAKL